LFFVDGWLIAADLGLPFRTLRLDRLARGCLFFSEAGGVLVLLVVDRGVLLLCDAVKLLLGLAQGGGGGRVARGARAGAWRKRTRLPASSMRSMALSGRWRSVM